MKLQATAILFALPIFACAEIPVASDSGQELSPPGHHVEIGATPRQAWSESATSIFSKGEGSSLVVEIFELGEGEAVENGDHVLVHYRGWVLGSEVQFDSSFDRDEPFDFGVGAGRVIKGWDLGLEGLTVGTRARLHIAPEYGYGSRDLSPDIPANSSLVFDVEVLGIRVE
jgi:FKBP-type peptidyl-prolyl cis-trans isomerase FkpA